MNFKDELVGSYVLVNSEVPICRVLEVSEYEKGYDLIVDDISFERVPDLGRLVQEYDDAFSGLSLMLLDSIRDQILKYNLTINGHSIGYFFLIDETLRIELDNS